MSGAPSSPGEGAKKARIEIIPLIDVIFFLLATFVLFTLLLNKIQSLPINLPVAAPPSANPPDTDDNVTLQVSDGGTLYWNKELIAKVLDRELPDTEEGLQGTYYGQVLAHR